MANNHSVFGRAIAATTVIASSVLLGIPAPAIAAPAAGGSIAGTVRNDTTAALEGICVQATDGHPYGSHVGSGCDSLRWHVPPDQPPRG